MFKSARQILWPRKHRGVRIFIYAVALPCVSVGMYFAVSSSPGSTASSGSAAVANGAVPASPVQPVTPASDLALIPGQPAKVAVWNSGRGGAALAAVSHDFGDALMAHGARQFVEMKQACSKLATAVTTARAMAPIPDAAMQRLYGKALAEMAKGAADCRAAISSHREGVEDLVVHEDTSMLNRAMSLIAAGANDLYHAIGKIKIRP
jgi:hypothetical protein